MTNVGSKVIKPPIERVVSGKIFKPDRAYLHKLWAKNMSIALTLWIGTEALIYGIVYGIYLIDPIEVKDAIENMNMWMPILDSWLIKLN
jgi:hypothetical protein